MAWLREDLTLRWLGATGDHVRTRNLYLRLLGGVYCAAFASWAVQQAGLIGSQGVLPAADYLDHVRRSMGGAVSPFDLPTVFLIDVGDRALALAAGAGITAGALLALGLLPLPSLFACWILYLSLVQVGGVFMRFQWDALLLEAGLVSLFLCPPSLRLSPRGNEPHGLALWLVRWLLFRLMFFSGWAKLDSHDAAWRDLSALTYHYWTQPLPTWTAWLIDGAPRWFHSLSSAVALGVELICPFLVFGPRRARIFGAFLPLFVLQSIILATGNYGFFNLLAIALCIPLLDDAALLPWWSLERAVRRASGIARALHGTLLLFVAGGYLVVTSGLMRIALLHDALPAWQERAIESVRPFHSINSYGLFATMTRERLEIGLEGSDDGRRWRAYGFRWKPGPPARRPEFTTPHMPRLDWQMWFAALGRCEHNQWFLILQQRLLEGSRPVGALFEVNPFADHPPRYLRTPAHHYRFARRLPAGDDAWWERTPAGTYCSPLTLAGGRLRRAELPAGSEAAATE